MRRDARGLPVTTDSAEAVAALDAFADAFIRYADNAAVLLDAVKADPGCALAQAYAAMLHMLLESREAPDLARPYRDAALKAVQAPAGVTDRERLLVDAARAWVEGDPATVLARLEAVVRDHPRDLLAMKLAQYHHLNFGNFAGMLRVAEMAAEPYRDDPHWLGMAAFAYEQLHLLEEAEAAASRALERTEAEPWAQHALAHVMETRGRMRDGVAFLRSVSHHWDGCNSFLYTHNWWHLALFHLDLDEPGEVLRIHDAHVWGRWKAYSQDQAGAVSLLVRLELRGVDVGDRWRDVADHVAARGDDHVQPFLDLHYVYALARDGRAGADRYLDSLEAHAATVPDIARRQWRDVAVPLARGMAAHARGDWDHAATAMAPAMPNHILVGGSHAQRDLFEQVYLDALVRSGRHEEAQQRLELRRLARPDVRHTHRQLAGVYAALGLPREAARAAGRGGRPPRPA
ncbi:MAG TPA: tetratricopeptide repeat protein [Azospirillaceae bacterium]|nr:tetratricopeptide repeat protein [Azospirillaceae bacterium]